MGSCNTSRHLSYKLATVIYVINCLYDVDAADNLESGTISNKIFIIIKSINSHSGQYNVLC